MASGKRRLGSANLGYALATALLLAGAPAGASEQKTFGRWTSHYDHSVPGEKLCWLVNGEVAFYVWFIEKDDYKGEWLTQYGSEEASFPQSFYAEIGGSEFSGEESVGGPALVSAMKAGLTMRYQYELPSGVKEGTVSLIGFTKGYRYCQDQVG